MRPTGPDRIALPGLWLGLGLALVLAGGVRAGQLVATLDQTAIRVKAVYVRLVDTGTLEALCHVWIPDSYAGESFEEAAQSLAFSLAREAKLISGK